MKPAPYRSVFKPLLDRLVALILGLVLLPVFALLALWIRWDSPGNPLFLQTRVGRNLKPFRIFKLRTMVANAPSLGPGFTSRGDARITKVGRFLRKTSLDELPQIYNVLLGDMSLIGPRPGLAAEANHYPSEEIYRRRHAMKPGISGLAQATLRSSGTFEKTLAADLHYIEACNLRLDLAIVFKTVKMIAGARSGN